MTGLESDCESETFSSRKSAVGLVLTTEKPGVGVRAEAKVSPSYPPGSYTRNQNSNDEDTGSADCTCCLSTNRSDGHSLGSLLSGLRGDLNPRLAFTFFMWKL